MNTTITVPLEAAGTRLDKFLVSKLPKFSRHFLQLAIKNGQIKVDARSVPIHYFLKNEQIINIANLTEPSQRTLTPSSEVRWKIVKELPDYLIIDKPAGLTVHPAAGVHGTTLIESIVGNYPEIMEIGEDKLRPGIVHRLDKDVSGLMVIARNQAMFIHLKNAFQNRMVLKKYLALVIGQVQQPSGVIDFPLARSKTKHGRIAARPKNDPTARTAITKFEVIKLFQHTTFLMLILETGRTHQIRAHLNAFGHPVVGDKIYHPAKLAFKATPGRIFLHSHQLGFHDLNNDWQTFVSPLPLELEQFLTQLK